MAGKIIVSSVQSDTDNSISFVANTGATIFSANLSHGIAGSFIADGTITAAKIADGAIVATEVADGAITGPKLGLTSINANNIVNGTITTTKIANNTISNTNIATGAVENYLRANILDFGMRNRIINGAMTINQRGSSTTSNGYSLDRWLITAITGSKMTVQQSSDAPTGFSNSLLITSSAATSIGSSDYYEIGQRIEGFNTYDLMFGTANARTVTVSFWVKSSLTGNFGASLQNSAQNRSYPFMYTVNSANTWEYKTITIAGDTSGTWVGATAGTGMQVLFGLGIGSTYQAGAGVWAGGYLFPTSVVNLLSTNGATLYITGVQLEEGSTATSFEYRSYGTELNLCLRYYETGSANPSCFADSFGNAVWEGFFKVDKRSAGNLNYDDANGNSSRVARWLTGSYATNITPNSLSSDGTKRFSGSLTGLSAGTLVKVGFNWAQNSEL